MTVDELVRIDPALQRLNDLVRAGWQFEHRHDDDESFGRSTEHARRAATSTDYGSVIAGTPPAAGGTAPTAA